MLTKTKIGLTALVIVGFASAALADGPIENKISDKYPHLEKIIQPAAGAADSAFADARRPVKPYTAQEKATFDRQSATDRLR